jgi:hypothetical protein
MQKVIGKDKDITIADDIRFILETRDGQDCLKTPYQITNVTVYFITREFTDSTASEYQKENDDQDLIREYDEVKKSVCLKAKQEVRAATDGPIALFGEQEIDGIDVVNGDRILVKNQENSTENGIYIVNEESWKRSDDANSQDNVLKGMYVFVENGIMNINTGWVLEAPKKIEIGTTPLEFFRFSSIDEPKESPDGNSKNRLEILKKQIQETRTKSTFFYKDAVAVKSWGGYTDPETGELFPAWLNPSMVPEDLYDKVQGENFLTPYEEKDQIIEGKFQLDWQPLDCREGDYFICWSWMPNLAGDVKSSHLFFSLEGSTQLTTSIPTHFTSPKKYEMLMDRYLPDMFKTIISESDLTPRVLHEFNNAVAKGFTFIENQANQIIDLLDANATHEQLLPLLSNMFNLKLKSNDPTLWRRQIKKAIPNFKKKGSIEGLKEALSDIGIKFLSLKKLWQVISKYTYQEHFDYKGSNTFRLSRSIVTPLDETFKLWKRDINEEWVELTREDENWHEDYVEINEENDELVWIGEDLQEGSSIRVLYLYREMPSSERTLDQYIQLLPLMDQRDERDQLYPIKNWNTHVIEEDDDLFDRIVPVRHPLADPIIWGRVRTEFPYSENAYNMDEYNGSKRDSYNPCDIDKEFLDPCSQCQSSKFILDLEVEKLSDESYLEVQKIVEEYMPFHAVVHSFNLAGAINEFIKPNLEKIEALIAFSKDDVLLAGEGQHIFNRDVDRSQIQDVKRNVLASLSATTNSSGGSSWSGLFKNQKVVLCPSGENTESDLYNLPKSTQGFEAINIDTTENNEDPFESSNLLEILGTTVKNYSLYSFERNASEVFSAVEDSMVGSLFEYRISNKIADYSANIEQSNQIIFEDNNSDFNMLGIITQHDVDVGNSNGTPWNIKISDKKYIILNILPDGTLLLEEESEITPIEGWELYDRGAKIKESDSSGQLTVLQYGLVSVSETNTNVKIGDYVYIDWAGASRRYRIKSFKNGYKNKFYIENYDDGDVGGENIKIYRRILENKVGRFAYEGLIFEADENIESVLSISNGANKDISNINSNNIKENYLLFRDQKYYSILEVDGSVLTLSGPSEELTKDGQEVEFMIYKFTKSPLELKERVLPAVPGYDFEEISRSGKGTIEIVQDNALQESLMVLNSPKSNEKIDLINQSESIDFNIEYKDEE